MWKKAIRPVASFFLILLAGLSVYANSLPGEFIYDDLDLVRDNPLIQNISEPLQFFQNDINLRTGRTGYFYRPFLWMSYALDHQVWKGRPEGYHLTNVLMHGFAAILLSVLVFLLFGDRTAGFLAGLFFVVHPVHTEAVSYISGRADSLAAFFLLFAFIFYLRAVRLKHWIYSVLLAITYAAALLSKEHSLVFLGLVLLFHVVFKEAPNRRVLIPLILISVGYGVLRYPQLSSLLNRPPHPSLLSERLPGFFIAVTEYIRILFVPTHLHMEYGVKLFSYSHPLALIGVVLLLGLFSALIVLRTNKVVVFGLGWFLLALLPVSNLFPINAFMAEHWLYLPSMGLFMILAVLISRAASGRYHKLTLFLTASLVCVWGVLTIYQNRYWQDPVYFYERTLSYDSSNARMLNNLAAAYKEKGEIERSKEFFTKAIQADPLLAEPYYNLAYFYATEGDLDKALEFYQKTVDLNPGYSIGFNNIGSLYEAQGKMGQALVAYQKALSLNPEYELARKNLEGLKKKMGIQA